MAFDAFMWIEGGDHKVEGETTDATMKDKKAFEIYSFSLGGSNPVTIGSAGGGSAGGKVSLSSFNVMKKTDKGSPSLFATCCEGNHYPKATVILRKAAGASNKQSVFLQYDFEEVFVESIQWSGSSGGDDSPTESVSFAYGKITMVYSAQDATGKVVPANNASWCLTTNTK